MFSWNSYGCDKHMSWTWDPSDALINTHTAIYTEHQKKFITSSERHSLKSKASKWIIFGHSYKLVILIKYIKKKRFAWIKNEKNAVKSQEVSFQKSQKLLASWAGSSLQTKPIRRSHNPHWNWMNSYWNVLHKLALWSSLGE